MRRAVLGVLLIVATSGVAAAQAPGKHNEIRAEIVGMRSNTGKVGCTLYNSADGFPNDPAKASARLWVNITENKAVCEFHDVPAGTYAVAVIHDENGNQKLDIDLMGVPKEGVGASNDAKSYGPPKFEDARFKFDGGKRTILIHMAYL